VLEVVDPGLLLALQDGGRPGFAHLGIPPSGACDSWGLAVANLLAGAPPGGVAVEVTLGGAELRVVETCVVSLAGADLGAERDDGHPLGAGAAHRLPAGALVRFAGSPARVRAYLGLSGGIAARTVLGSASTTLRGGLGGVDGRALQAGDLVEPLRRGDLRAAGRLWPSASAPHPADRPGPVRFVPGPDLRHLPADVTAALAAASWTVGRAGDRMGIRLEGPALPAGREILSHPVIPGAIQVPGDGLPIVLLVDGPTIGGYPVAGVLARAELPRMGQARPGDVLRLAPQDAVDAQAVWREQRRLLAMVAAAFHPGSTWS
jgi:biotin-dependent carboxylase-like uncharacterized protein